MLALGEQRSCGPVCWVTCGDAKHREMPYLDHLAYVPHLEVIGRGSPSFVLNVQQPLETGDFLHNECPVRMV